MFDDVNLVAVGVSAIAALVIGMIWYSKSAFGAAWMKAAGIKESDAKKAQKEGMGKMMVGAFIQGGVMAVVLSKVLMWTGGGDTQAVLTTTSLVWLGFVATVQFGSVLWERKSLQYFWINSLYWLVTLGVMGLILTNWA